MGFQKIAQMRDELNKKLEAAAEIIKTAQECADNHRKIAEQYKKIDATREAQWQKAVGLKTLGIKELEEYKDAVIAQCSSWENPPPSDTAITRYLAEQRRSVDEVVQAHLDKLAASFPSEVSPGMKFRDGSTKMLWEVKEEMKLPNLPAFKANPGPRYAMVSEDGKKTSASLPDLKSKYKYIRGV